MISLIDIAFFNKVLFFKGKLSIRTFLYMYTCDHWCLFLVAVAAATINRTGTTTHGSSPIF